jgi:hypothetical protein
MSSKETSGRSASAFARGVSTVAGQLRIEAALLAA